MDKYTVYTNALVSNGNRQEKFKRDRKAQKMIRNLTPMKVKEMKEHGDKLFDEWESKRDYLIDSYEQKRLKSKRLIKQARKLAQAKKQSEENIEENN